MDRRGLASIILAASINEETVSRLMEAILLPREGDISRRLPANEDSDAKVNYIEETKQTFFAAKRQMICKLLAWKYRNDSPRPPRLTKEMNTIAGCYQKLLDMGHKTSHRLAREGEDIIIEAVKKEIDDMDTGTHLIYKMGSSPNSSPSR